MDALILIDIQNDFLPGGALAVPNGDEILPIVYDLLALPFSYVVTTKDWHPKGHVSFATNHPGKKAGEKIDEQLLWPEHCIQNTEGAALPSILSRHLPEHREIYKGTNLHIDSYSAFFDNQRQQATALHEYLQKQDIHSLCFAGLATDYCVKFSVIDACQLGYEVFVVKEACRGVEIHPGDVDRAWEEMEKAGARCISIQDIQRKFPKNITS